MKSLQQLKSYSKLISFQKFFFSKILIKMPQSVESITEGDVKEILVKVGDFVKEGDIIMGINTDKSTLDIRAGQSGRISKLFFNIGDSVLINQDLIEIDTSQIENVTSTSNEKKTSKKESSSEVSVNQSSSKIEIETKSSLLSKEINLKEEEKKEVSFSKQLPDKDLFNIFEIEESSNRELSVIRKGIIEKMKEISLENAVLSTFNECDLTNTIELLEYFNKDYEKRHKQEIKYINSDDNNRLSLLSLFIYAMSKAVKDYPQVNAIIDKDVKNIIFRDYIDVIVNLRTKSDLLVNVVLKDTQKKGYADIYKELLSFEERINKNQNLISIEEIGKGTISINNSNLSMLNTSAIEENTTVKVGINKIETIPFCVDNNPKRIETRKVMLLSLTYDHRLIDGREGVLYLKRIKEIMENPVRIVFDI